MTSADGSALAFATPVELRFAYDVSALSVLDEHSLSIAAWDTNPGTWRMLLSAVDARRHLVRAKLDRLTIFALVGKPKDQ